VASEQRQQGRKFIFGMAGQAVKRGRRHGEFRDRAWAPQLLSDLCQSGKIRSAAYRDQVREFAHRPKRVLMANPELVSF